jgi:hypothetical protein
VHICFGCSPGCRRDRSERVYGPTGTEWGAVHNTTGFLVPSTEKMRLHPSWGMFGRHIPWDFPVSAWRIVPAVLDCSLGCRCAGCVVGINLGIPQTRLGFYSGLGRIWNRDGIPWAAGDDGSIQILAWIISCGWRCVRPTLLLGRTC